MSRVVVDVEEFVSGSTVRFESNYAHPLSVAREVVSRCGFGEIKSVRVGMNDKNGKLEGWYRCKINASPIGCGVTVIEERNSGFAVGREHLFRY